MSTQDWIEKDYYKVLGVSKDASADEIKKAFRKIARANHPDANPDNAGAEKRFKEASEANSVLSDPKKRKEYDEARSYFGGGGFRFPGGGGGRGGSRGGQGAEDLFRNAQSADYSDISDLFGGLFNRGGGGSARSSSGMFGGGGTRSQQRRGADVEGEVTLDFADAIEGKTVPIQLVSNEACQACHGTGAKAGTMPTVCPTCEGSGSTTSTSGGLFSMTEPCPDCRGRGLIVENPCPVCHGSGRGQSTRTIQVRIPAGVQDGQRIRIKGKGGPGENGGPAGDLYVVVHVRPDKLFGRKGDNLTITVPVTFTEAALGATIQVPTLKGLPVRLKIPAGTPNGRTFRARGKGGPRSDGTPGDLLVTIEVVVPDKLSEEARTALKAYAEAAHEPDPRAGLGS